MSDKEWKIECPCCHTELRVDALTGRVSSWLQASDAAADRKRDASERFDAHADRVKGRIAGGEDRMDRALDKERSRARDLDDAFDAAKRRARNEPDQGG